MPYEFPRHVHKAGGLSKVVTADEWPEAEADGWVIDPNTLPKPTGIVLTDAPDVVAESESPDEEDDSDGDDAADVETADAANAPKRRGRPRKQ